MSAVTVLLADDNVIVRSGVRALLASDPQVEVVAEAADLDETVALATELAPRVVVTDIRMPPTFTDEGIVAAKEIRRRHPGTGVVVLSQYDDPAYAVGLLAEGASGYGYLLKARVADEQRLCRAVHEVAAGGSVLDPEVVAALVAPVRAASGLTSEQETLLEQVASGRAVKSIAAATGEPPEAVDGRIEELFLVLARDASSGRQDAVRRLRSLHTAILEREEQGLTLSRLLPSGLAARLDRFAEDRTDELEVSVLMSDVRGYSGIAERTGPAELAQQLGEHRAAMNAAVLGLDGTVMQYVGDAVMAVFGAPAPVPDHAARAVLAALDMHARQRALDARWAQVGRAPFGLGIGVSTGRVAAALLGSAERVEYTLVGDTVNLAQRLQDLARPAGTTVVSAATVAALTPDGAASNPPTALGDRLAGVTWRSLGERPVKGRHEAVSAYVVVPAPAGGLP